MIIYVVNYIFKSPLSTNYKLLFQIKVDSMSIICVTFTGLMTAEPCWCKTHVSNLNKYNYVKKIV